MPFEPGASDEQIRAVRDALRPTREPFHSALARTIEEVRTLLATRTASPKEHVRGAEAALGAFAQGRVDAQRFSALLSQTLPIDASAAARTEQAFRVLRGLGDRLASLFELTVPPGGSLRDAVDRRLAEIGRAFGAAHVVAAARANAYDEERHAPFLDAFPFGRWSEAERALAPGLQVEVAGADCRAAALSEFLDGRVRIVLHVTGPCPVAPLARLLTPRTFVAQTNDPGDVAAVASWDGPGVVALVPGEAARFRHVPAAGVAGPLEIQHAPEGRPGRVGGVSGAQQEEDLRLLRCWSAPPAGSAAESARAADAGRLASWLMQQADLGSIG